MQLKFLVKFLRMFFLLLNGNVKMNQMKKRGGAPVSEARTQRLLRDNVLCSSRQHHRLWPGLGATRWMGEAVLVFG